MTEWHLYFTTKKPHFMAFAKKLIEEKLIDFIKIGNKEVPLDLARIRSAKNSMYLGWYVRTFRHRGTQQVVITLVGMDKGIHAEMLKTISLAGETLKPSECAVYPETYAQPPIYKGPWSLDIFEKKIRPQIEYDKEEYEEEKDISTYTTKELLKSTFQGVAVMSAPIIFAVALMVVLVLMTLYFMKTG